MAKIIISRNYIYEVTKDNGEKPLKVTRLYRWYNGQWRATNKDIFEDAGRFILQNGGVDAVLSKCREVNSLTDFVEHINATSRETENSKAERHRRVEEIRREIELTAETEYKKLFTPNEVIETNAKSVYTLLRYLNTKNWGVWELPRMSIGYSCNQYDCDGTTATTIKLDRPIEVDGELGARFCYGAPHGHLVKYRRISNI